VQQRPDGVGIRGVRVPTGEARRCAGEHERADRHTPRLEGDGEVRDVFAQIACELQCGGSPAHEHDGDGRIATVLDQRDALVGEGLPHAVLAASVGEPDGLDPRRP